MCMYISMYIYVYIYVYTHVCTYVYMYMYMYLITQAVAAAGPGPLSVAPRVSITVTNGYSATMIPAYAHVHVCLSSDFSVICLRVICLTYMSAAYTHLPYPSTCTGGTGTWPWWRKTRNSSQAPS